MPGRPTLLEELPDASVVGYFGFLLSSVGIQIAQAILNVVGASQSGLAQQMKRSKKPLTRVLCYEILPVAPNAAEISGVSCTQTETYEVASLGFFTLGARTRFYT